MRLARRSTRKFMQVDQPGDYDMRFAGFEPAPPLVVDRGHATTPRAHENGDFAQTCSVRRSSKASLDCSSWV